MDGTIEKSDIFAGAISEDTKKILGSYQNLKEDAGLLLTQMFTGNEKLTQDHVDIIIGKYKAMNDEVLKQLDTRYQEERAKLVEFFGSSDAFTKEEEAKQLLALDERYAQEREKTVSQGEQIATIIQESKDKHGQITEDAYIKIGEITNQQGQTMIANSVKSAQEQETILSNLKNQSDIITLEQALKVSKNSKKQMDETIKHANDEYDGVVQMAEYKRDVTGEWSGEQADAVIEEAKRERDQTVNSAKRQHDDVVLTAYKRSGQNAKQANWETYDVLGWQEKLANGIIKASNWIKRIFGIKEDRLIGDLQESGYMKEKRQAPTLQASYAKGTVDGTHGGGLALVGEEGYELANIPNNGLTMLGVGGQQILDLPKGSSVLPHKETKKMLKQFNFPAYATGTDDGFFDALFKGAKSLWKLATDRFDVNNIVDDIPNTAFEMMGNPLNTIGKWATEWIDEKFDNMFNFNTKAFGGNRAKMARSAITQALMITGKPMSWLTPMMTIAQKESGFDPNAINLWDINAQRGDPSVGLFQIIQSTFNRHKLKGMNDRRNPLHSAVTAIRYMDSQLWWYMGASRN